MVHFDIWKKQMKTTTPHLITEANLSIAWARAFLHVLDGADDALLVAIRGFDEDLPPEDSVIATALNEQLSANEIPRIAHTALTIVPYDRWLRRSRPSIEDLSNWYLTDFLPRLKARCPANRRGTYFERFVSFSGVRRKGDKIEQRTVNQLSYIIDFWKKAAKSNKRPRQSALQVACFDPAKDDTGAALSGFPCLQQLSFTYHETGTLEVSAYYPTQYLFERAYGNYLGLCQLGHVIAQALGVKLTRFTCFIARPEMGGKAPTRVFADTIRARLALIAPNDEP